jgi:hypothetical protein
MIEIEHHLDGPKTEGNAMGSLAAPHLRHFAFAWRDPQEMPPARTAAAVLF